MSWEDLSIDDFKDYCSDCCMGGSATGRGCSANEASEAVSLFFSLSGGEVGGLVGLLVTSAPWIAVASCVFG